MPPNVNNNPLLNHGNQGVNMITLDEKCDMRGTIMLVRNMETPRPVMTTIIFKKPDYNSKAMSWDYQAKEKTKIINTATTRGMT
ncbi:hypothetical protein HAX54_029598, partial [Datura stramonium]|nr:hypothetical protein [Datura stramonium]